MPLITIHSLVAQRDKQTAPDKVVNGITYVLQGNKGEIHTLNESASFIWNMLKKPYRVSSLITLVVQRYNGNQKDVTHDVLTYLQYCLKEDLIQIIDN